MSPHRRLLILVSTIPAVAFGVRAWATVFEAAEICRGGNSLALDAGARLNPKGFM